MPAARVLSSLWMVLGDLEQARGVLQAACDANPESPVAYEALGQFVLSSGDQQAAASHFEKATGLADSDPWVLLSLGESITIAGFQAQSEAIRNIGLAALERAAALSPDSPVILRDLGMASASSGRFDLALQSLQRAAELAPENQAIRRDLEAVRARIGP